MPLAPSLDHVGPLTRTCRDAREAVAVLADSPELLTAASKPLSRLSIGVPQGYLERIPLQPGIAAAFEALASRLQASGVTLK